MTTALLAIDQGTTSSRAIAFAVDGRILTSAQQEFEQHYPREGWVEHDPEAIWRTTLAVTRQVVADCAEQKITLVAAGITNQRETTVVWDRKTGKPIYNAIVWQDRRTAADCRALVKADQELEVQQRTGLLLDPYFSATKIAWILDNVDGARQRAAAGELAFGTIDCFLIHRLTGGKVHATDATNASRTNLFNIHTNAWDPFLCDLFRVPTELLPEVRDSADDYGITASEVVGASISISGVAGDQQAATVGQCCFEPGSMKSTYGTGCFVMLNTGQQALTSKNRLLTTVAYRLNGQLTYALEGSIFVAGAAIQWLRDELGAISHPRETQQIAAGLDNNGGVYMVPAFTGLGAPHWDPEARGAILGLTRGVGRDHIVRAALESVCYQTRDLLQAMGQDGVHPIALKVDGGMVANDWLLEFLAGILEIRVTRPQILETTALGAAYLAGLQAGVYDSMETLAQSWRLDRHFDPAMSDRERRLCLGGWDAAVGRVLTAE
jgi:glycerol kinase